LQAAYAALGRLLGAAPRNLAMAQNSTVAFAQALAAFDLGPGDRILTSRQDYASNQIMYLALARRRGVEIIRAPDGPEGGIDPQAVRELVAGRRPTLVALTWIPTNSGLVQPAEAIGEICREAEVPYLVDACQAVGQMPVNVNRLQCDYLAATCRKFLRGPRGVGFLYVSDRALAAGAYPLTVDMHGATWTAPEEFELTPDARRFESWEISYALVLGLGAAAEYALGVGLERAREWSWTLARYARARLAEVAGVRVLDRGPELCAIATAELGGRPAEKVKLALRARGINTSSPERDDAVIDMDEKGAVSALRVSPHYYNTADEIDAAAAATAEVMETIPPTRRP
jgi:selenocysteine lyase/cysteine desulfurase